MNFSETKPCPVCKKPIESYSNGEFKKFCSLECRRADESRYVGESVEEARGRLQKIN